MNIIFQENGGEGKESHLGRSLRVALILFNLCFILINLFTSRGGFCATEGQMTDRIAWPSEIDGWTWDQEDKAFDRKTLFNHIDGAAEVYLAYNFQQASVHRYVKTGQPDITAEVYIMGSSEDAFGVFSLERQDPEVGIGQGSEFGGGLLRFWKGRYFVSVLGEGEGNEIEAAVLNFGRKLVTSIKETGQPPRLLGYLPEFPSFPSYDKLCFVHSHILLNRCFFLSHDNILKLGSDVQAVLARYHQGNTKIRLLIVDYPSEARAGSALVSFKSAYMPETGQNNSVRTEDNTWTKIEQYRNFFIVVLGTAIKYDADRRVQATIAKIKEEGS
jgi:hypothetical protein